jgi:hypothetical protein
VHEFPFSRRVRLAGIVAIWGPLMACQPTAPAAPSTGLTATTAQATGVQKNDKSDQKHLWRVNPSPKQVFEVEFEIHDAPGPLSNFEGSASYHAPNCWFVTSEWAGARAVPQTGLTIPMKRLGPNRFLATLSRDGMVDEDYYGNGVCQWALMSVTTGFSASGAKDETNYVVRLDDKEMKDGTAIRQYYWKGDYPRLPGTADTSSRGDRNPEGFGPTHRNNLFSIAVKVRAKS